MTTKAERFIPENERKDTIREELSPSGQFKLVISNFTTGKNTWDYAQGKVYRVGSEEPIAVVQRNYGSFPFLFIEGHPKGNFLVCGEDYQGQTVIDLDSGKRLDVRSNGAEKGFGFCWASYEYVANESILLVEGCFWAAPYEYKLFDFSDPMSGWPEIECEDGIHGDLRKPIFNADGTITAYLSEWLESDEYEDDEEEDKPGEIRVTWTYRREGMKLVLLNEWVSEKEKANRIASAKAQAEYEAWRKEYEATDPLYLAFVELSKDPIFTQEEWLGRGVTHERWCPGFTVVEPRWCKRIVKRGNTPYTVDLEWAIKTGPVLLEIFKDGKHLEKKIFWEHSVESMQAAFAYARGLLETT